jgi:hypothetical protein
MGTCYVDSRALSCEYLPHREHEFMEEVRFLHHKSTTSCAVQLFKVEAIIVKPLRNLS